MLRDYLAEAERIVDDAVVGYDGLALNDPALSKHFEALRWFWLPSEVLARLRSESRVVPRLTKT